MERPTERIVERRLDFERRFGRRVKNLRLTPYEQRVLAADRRAMRRLPIAATDNAPATMAAREIKCSTRHVLAVLWRIQSKFELEQMRRDYEYVPRGGKKK